MSSSVAATTAATSSIDKTRLIAKSLYRVLLRVSSYFTSPSPDAVVLNCLLDRSTTPSSILLPKNLQPDTTTTTTSPPNNEIDLDRLYYTNLLHELFGGGLRLTQFPMHVVDSTLLRRMIRREFRAPYDDDFSPAIRRQVAFLALRRLNEKLSWFEDLTKKSNDDNAVPFQQQHKHVVSMLLPQEPTTSSSSYLQPGTFLIAHPNLTGYFRRTVICILDHPSSSSATEDVPYGTYGLVINRWANLPGDDNHHHRPILTLKETFPKLPLEFQKVFGNCPVRLGGPVQGAFQMLHCLPPNFEYLDPLEQLGGLPLPFATVPENFPPVAAAAAAAVAPPHDADPEEEENINDNNSEPSIYFKGNVFKAAEAIRNGHLSLEQVQFFVGASTWMPGQLQSEVDRGVWLPCRAPPQLAFSGGGGGAKDHQDLWRSMLAACGKEEAKLANLMCHDNGNHPFGRPCDSFPT